MNETVNEAGLSNTAPVSSDGAITPVVDGRYASAQPAWSMAVAATFTADPVAAPLRFWAETLELPAQITVAPYGQLLQELINPHSLLSQNRAGCNVLLIRPQDWIRDRSDYDVDSNIEHLRSVAAEVVRGVKVLRARNSSTLFVFFCPASSALEPHYALAVAAIQDELTTQLSQVPQLHCGSHADIADLYPAVQWEDLRTDRIAHIPYSDDYFVALATFLMRRAATLLKPACKVIAIDCDNTLWKGICGEDGAAGVQLTPAHLELQRSLVRQHDAGVLLCLCSKNNVADVEAVFAGNLQMPLREEHLICSRVNWQSKSANLRSLAEELGLGLDSFVLLDDSAMECAEVRTNCPQVLTLQVPETPEAIEHFLKHCWVFDRVGATQDARRRTAQYKENRARREAQQHATDLESFLASLQLTVVVEPMQPMHLARVAELIQRTNQFNLSTMRRRASEIEALWTSGDLRILVVHARDRFGDYGLVGSVFFRRVAESLDVDTWVLSCRALGRGVEHRIVNELGHIASREGARAVTLKFRRSARNAPAAEFLHRSFAAFRAEGTGADEELFVVPIAYARSLTATGPALQGEVDEAAPSTSRIVSSATSAPWYEGVAPLVDFGAILSAVRRYVARDRQQTARYVAPRTAVEATLAGIWGELLGLEKVGIEDDFFASGGDSLLAVRAVARIESVLGLELPLHELFERPTVAEVAEWLSHASRAGAPIEIVDRERALPLSWSQQRLWFIDRLEGGSTAYHIPLALRLRGRLEAIALEAALNDLAQRHEVLRTAFVKDASGEPVQVITTNAGIVVERVDLRVADQDRAVEAESREELLRPFDLAAGSLIRARLMRLADDEHLLLLTLHHMVADGWSIRVLIRELSAIYEARLQGRRAELPPLPIQYADYACWQRSIATASELEAQVAYWREHLQGAPAVLDLPADRARPATQSYRGANVRIALEPALTQELKLLSRDMSVTLAMTLYAAWSMLLARLSGQDDIVVGVPIANRRRTELEGLIGYFVNTLAVRVRVEDDPSVTDLLQRVKQIMLDAYVHQDAPFEQVVKALQPVRSLSHSPIFQVMLVMQNPSSGPVQLGNLELCEQDVPLHTAQFDLLLSLQESSTGLSGNLNYATDLFDAATVERWIACFKTLLQAMVSSPQMRVSALPWMDAEERRQVVETFNATRSPFESDKTLHGLIEEQVQRAPDGCALLYEGQSLTYAELNARANQLARYLRGHGLGPDQLVGICAERSIEMVVGLLGILKAGAAYVPIDPDYPAERLTHMLADSSPRVLLTQAHIRSTLPQSSAKVIALDADWHEIAALPTENLDAHEIGLRPDHLAYVIFTSGSTGRPKGAMNEHRALVNRLQWMQSEYQLTAGDKVLQKTPFSFDVSAWEFFWTLMTGACLVVARPRGHQDPLYLRSLMEQAGVTTLHFVPSMLQVFLEQHRAGQCPSIRRVICSGEELPMSLQRKFYECLPQARLANLYGPTEAAIDVTYWECRPEDAQGRVPIGKPIANVQMYVLDAHRAPVPVGVAGEIYIGGVGVGRGYLNRTELTAERFVRDPFSSEPGARLYKTGDLGRWRTDGAIEYLGRNDNQVKIRGLRIELGEIEAQLLRQPSVKEAVVVAREDVPGEKRLVAYVVLELASVGASEAAEALRTQLKAVLPEFMVPSAVVVLDRMPLSPNGKLERRALPMPDRAAFAARHHEAPQGEIEEIVAGVWQTLLRIERVGRHDNFFELGGHSLLIVQMMDRLRQVGLAAELRQVFESATLASLASLLTRGVAEDTPVPANAIPTECVHITPDMLPLVRLEPDHIERIVRTVPGGAANVQDIYPLSPLQEGLLFHHLLSREEGDTYVVPTVLAVDSRSRLDQLIASLQAVIDRHDVLRTSIVWEQLPQPVQVVHRTARLPVAEAVLDPTRDLAHQLHEWIRPERQRMNLQQAPLLQLQTAADPHDPRRWYVLLQIHHIIGDNTSQEMVIAEVIAHLDGRAHALPVSLPYRNHVAQSLAHRHQHDAEAFFRRKLGDVDEPTAPFGLLDVHGSGGQTEEVSEQIDAKLAARARLSARRLGVSSATLFHAAWGLVVAHTSGRDDVVFGSVLLGRLHGSAGAQRTLGMFINTLPLRLQLQGLTAQQLVERTQGELIELLNHEQASLAQAQRCSGVDGSAPLFTALLNYRHSASAAPVRWSDAAGLEVFAGHERTNYPITLSVDDSEHGLILTAQTDKRVSARRLARCMHQAVAALVEALEQAPQSPALHLQVLPEDEWHQVVRLFNRTEAPYPQEQTIHQLFEAQVARTPGAIAVVYRDVSLTYEQLNEEANRLAHHLRSQAITTGSYVPILISRSLLMLIAQLAVLKSGAVYVPVDPELPLERRTFMIRDCAAEVILTDGPAPADLSDERVRAIDCADVLATAPRPSLGNPRLLMTSLAPAYVLYTSGSTGVPKGVVVAHRSVNRLAFNNGFVQIGPQDCLVHYSNPAFDASTFEVWGALLGGARVLIVPQDVVLEGERFAQLLQREAPTILYMSVGLFNQYTQVLADVFRDLPCLMVGGDALDAAAIRRVQRVAPPRRLLNAYGPTECTVFATLHPIEAVEEGASSVPIGKPMANAQIYILDRRGEPVAVGVVGELYIGGAGVALGYLNRSELSRERFVPDRFSGTAGAVMYRTGDLGRWREDGAIEFLGRNDQQVKLRGFRVELGEIEARLSEHAQIKETSVLARQDGPGQKRLVAYFVPKTADAAPSSEELRGYLKALLPEYMVPSAFVQLDRMPLTSSGKVDRRALPAPSLDAFSTRAYQRPQGEVEEILCGIWQSLLNVEQVGRQDNFFELGGHSLLMVQMMERLRRLGLSAQVRSVFENPRLADLAAVLSTEVTGQYEVPPKAIAADCRAITPEMLPLVELAPEHIEHIVQTVPGGAANIQDIYPLAPLQEGILFHHLLDEGGDTYVLPTVLSLPSQQRVQQLIGALQSVIDRHEVLRTAVLWEQLPRPVQVVYRQASLPVEQVELDPLRGVQDQLQEWIHPSRQRLDIRNAPLLRLQVARDPHEEQWYVMLQLHHMTIDHVSLEIVISEVVAHMEGRAQGLPEAVPYRNHVAQSLAYARAHDADAFFRAKLGDVDEPTTPFGLLDVHGDGTQIEDAYETVEPELAQRIRAQARRLGVSAATLFHAGWALVVAHTSGRDDVVFGSVLLGRMQGSAGGQRTLGMFINTLPLRLRLAEVTTSAFVEQTQRELVELLSHEQASLAAAQRCSAMVGNAPLFSALLNFRHSVPDSAAEWASAAGVTVMSSQERTNYPVTLSVDDLGSGFTLKAQVDKRVAAPRITAYLHRAMRSLTEALEQAPHTPVLELDIIPPAERRQLDELNATQAPYARGKLIHQLFEEQVLRTPEAAALVHGQRELTYRELNARATRLARYLRELGVGADQPVGICVQRRPEMVIGVLAILKAGAAYLPLDPSYPPERLAYMLEDAAPRIVLTQVSLKSMLPAQVRTVLLGDELEELGDRTDEDGPVEELGQSSTSLLYLIYTSGSTGRPKGTAMPHRAMVNLIEWHRHHLPVHEGCRVLQFAALSFDVAFQEIFSTLCTGGTLVLLDEWVRRDAAALLELLRKDRIERLFVPPLMLQSLAECLRGSGAVPPALREVIVAGEQLRISDEIVELFGRLPQCRLHNHYGPTETHVVTALTLPADARQWPTLPTIGRPIANTQIHILNRQGRQVPVGVAGEVYIAGANLAHGYLHRPQLTAERFVRDPFGADAAARMYKTGDLGRWCSDGTIEYLARNDDQVKIRGFRIELGEIEAQLAKHEHVKEAAVVAREDVPGQKRLVAYVTRRADRDPSIEQLSAHLKQRLPDYMVPSAFVVLEQLPLTPSGKLNRRALPAPEIGAFAVREYEAPQGEVEQALAQIWSEVLGVDRIGRSDDFFELGGHSLLALKALFKTNQRLDVSLRVGEIYKHPTIRGLAVRISAGVMQDEPVDLVREATLSADIVGRPELPHTPARAILLTGATGFVGRFLLAELLSSTDATLYCLVRAPSRQQASARLTATLLAWDLWQERFEGRIVAIDGDLRLPRLGLDEATYEELRDGIDSIYHCATSMNHLETYAMAKPANVDSARQLLELALSGRPKLINHISTLGVFNAAAGEPTRIVHERTSIDSELHYSSQGYTASKWVSEKIILTAAERGIPCNVFRLGLVWADSRQGRFDEQQNVNQVLKSALLSGHGIRSYRYPMPPTPVDYVARAIVFLGEAHGKGGEVFHISAASQGIGGLFERVGDLIGVSLQLLSYYDWICLMKRLHEAGMSLPAVPLIEYAFSMDHRTFQEHQRHVRSAANIRFDFGRTHAELERAGIETQQLNDELLRVCLEAMIARDPQLQQLIDADAADDVMRSAAEPLADRRVH